MSSVPVVNNYVETDELDVDGIKSMATIDTSESARVLQYVMSSRVSSSKKSEALDKKVARRQQIRDEQFRRMRIKEAEYERARARWNESDHKLDILMAEVRKLSRHTDSLDYLETDAIKRLELINDVYGDVETARHRAAALHSMGDILSRDYPIKYEVTPIPSADEGAPDMGYTQKLTWSTNPFTIITRPVNDAGQVLMEAPEIRTRARFGPFEISVQREFWSNSGSSSLSATLVWRESAVLVNDYPHPHVSTSGEICLGSAKASILELMKVGDYVGVISLMMEVLQSYNPRDPYHHLQRWEPTIYNTKSCSHCNEILLFCECSRDIATGEIVDEKFLNDCGATYQNCLINHERHDDSCGINGSPCRPSRHSGRFNPEMYALMSEDIVKLETIINKLKQTT